MPDRIEKRIVLRAPQHRVWRALTDSAEFGRWFGMKLDGPFQAGTPVRGVITPTTVDAEVAKAQEPYRGLPLELQVEQIQPQDLFSFRWHPYAVERDVDYSDEPATLVVFTLEAVAGGTQLTVVESGFDKIPLARRAKAFSANEGGWSAVLKLVEGYLAHAA